MEIKWVTDFFPESLLILISSTLVLMWIIRRKRYNLPPGPKGYPFVGCMPMLGNEPHVQLYKWAQEYGDIYGLHIGRNYVVVISDPAIAKEVFKQATVSDRPPDFFYLQPDGVGIVEMNGQEWLEQRRYTMREMKNIGLGRTVWDNLLQEEAELFIKYLEDSKRQPLDYTYQLLNSFSNNIMSLVTGKQLPAKDVRRDIFLEGAESSQTVHIQSGLAIIFPKLYKFLISIGIINIRHHLKKIMKLNVFIRKEIDACLKERRDKETFITRYVQEMEDENKRTKHFFSERGLVGNVQALMIAGTDTPALSFSWLLLSMAIHQDVQKKVHQELDSVLGHSNEPISYLTDRNRLPFCLATIKEAQRWRTVAPLNLYHRCTTDVKVKDYDIPAGSDFIGFLYAFHTSPKYWPEPEQFKPERFLDEAKNLKKVEFAPFSLGKRKCPGELVAYMELFVFFTSVMRKFHIVMPEQDAKFDLRGNLAVTLRPKPHKLQFILRKK